jgi:hypothetical protein
MRRMPLMGVTMPGKRIQFDEATWGAVDLLARDRMMDFQELADEAFSDLLKKYGRPVDLKTALRRSVREAGDAAAAKPAAAAPASGKRGSVRKRRRSG